MPLSPLIMLNYIFSKAHFGYLALNKKLFYLEMFFNMMGVNKGLFYFLYKLWQNLRLHK